MKDVRSILEDILLSPVPSIGFQELEERGVLQKVLPEVYQLHGIDQSPFHRFDVFQHTMIVIDNLELDLVLMWAGLLHDIGKFETRSVDEKGHTHFIDHEIIGALMAESVLTGLGYPSEFVNQVKLLVRLHMRPHSYSSRWTRKAVRRLLDDAGGQFLNLIKLATADQESDMVDTSHYGSLEELVRRTMELETPVVERVKLPIDGDDIMNRYHLKPGKLVGKMRNLLVHKVVEGVLDSDDKETAYEMLDDYLLHRFLD